MHSYTGTTSLTPSEKVTLAALKRLRRENYGVIPTYRELADATGASIGGVQYRLEGLRLKGFIRSKPGTPRAIQIVPRKRRAS
jgi:SOS-response transcriptional repressor LexA